MMKSCRLFKSLRACLLILSLACMSLPALAQNNSNTASTPPQSSGNTSSTTTTTTTQTTQTTRPTQTTTTQTSDNAGSNTWIWIVVLGLVALLAIAFIAMRGRSDRRNVD
ncbi:MAG TPA: hypothetical protein VF528_13545 [Pyrinomonadaceae bacterium]|jgi:hypothetical protein